jgi:hypothetical protein
MAWWSTGAVLITHHVVRIYIYIHTHTYTYKYIHIYIYVIDISNYVYLELYMQGKQQCGIFGMASTPDEKKSRLGG